jgi:glycosyltransferase involved in cell wall biosynthesis
MRAEGDHRAAGVSLYTQQLLAHLPLARPDHTFLAFQAGNAPCVPGVRRIRPRWSTDQPGPRIAWEHMGLPWQVHRHRVDLLHAAVNVLPAGGGCPGVVTVHDLSFLRHPERMPRSRSVYLRVAVGLSVRRARRVIAISEHTRRELVEVMGVPEEQVVVVPSGVDRSFRPLPRDEVDAFRREVFGGRPYLLHVGTLEPRKNIDVLIRAFDRLQRRGAGHVLALVGAPGWMYQSLFDLVRTLGLEERVRFVDYVHPSALPLWYNGADLFAYPSVYEGFGLPVLEAMASGVPVVTSASSAMEEVAGGACLTVEPGSEESLAAALERALGDPGLRGELRDAGLRRAAQYSWADTARRTVAVYEAALAGS